MHRIIILIAAAGFCLQTSCMAFGVVTHYADPWVVGLFGEQVKFSYTAEGVGSNSGGPFTATLNHADGSKDVWLTFCVEAGAGSSEAVNLGTTYKVWSTDLHVASNTGDYVTDAAKWLYYQSLHDPGLLAGYVPGDIASDSYLQEAIWHGVLKPDNNPLATPFSGDAVTWFDAAATATAGDAWADADLVRVLNPASLFYFGFGAQAQSQLYEVDACPVPEPAAMQLFAAGVLSLCACTRRWLKTY